MSGVSGLTVDDQMTHYMGAVVRGDTAVEHALTRIYFRLCEPGLGWADMRSNFDPVLRGCQNMLANHARATPAIPVEIASEATALLKDVQDAHARRNDVAHAIWMPDDEQPGIYQSQPFVVLFRVKPRPSMRLDVAEVRRCSAALESVEFRLAALDGLLLGRATGRTRSVEEALRAAVRGEYLLDEERGQWVRHRRS